MLSKLLKYDFEIQAKSLIPYYLVTILTAVLTRILGVFKDITFIKIIGTPIRILFILLLIGIIFYTFFVTIKYFYKNFFKDEGYLTHTLPVTKNALLLSKALTSTIYFILSLAVLVLSLLIAISNVDKFFDLFNNILITYNINVTNFYLFSIAFIILSYISYLTLFYISLALGSISNNNKILYSIIWGIVVYLIIQVISTIGLGILLLIDPNIININSPTIMIDSIGKILFTSLIISIICTLGCYIITKIILDKKLNLE